jgi:Mn2+/Fe2+ NRAMP family transporter
LITGFLGIIVAVMGFAFLFIALKTDVTLGAIVKNSFIPSLPQGSDLLLIGLIGTTIVPYNIFLGNGISHGQEIKQMRIGLIVAIIIGGIISMSILVVGTTVQGAFSFEFLKEAMEEGGGKFFGLLLGIGLFAAGISSSITSPFAAAVTFQSCFKKNDQEWGIHSLKFRSVWMTVMLIGLSIGLTGLKVIPVIITAQAINGLLLPIVACYLLILINKRHIMGAFKNSILLNLISLLVIGVCFFVGLNNIFSVLARWNGLEFLKAAMFIKVVLAIGGMLAIAFYIFVVQKD